MTEPKRLTEVHPPGDPLELRAAELVRGAAEVEPWNDLAQARLRRSVLGELDQPPRRWLDRRALVGGAITLGCLGVVALAINHARGRGLSSHLTTSADTQVQLVPAARPGDDDQLNLMRGLVNVRGADPARGLAVRTPHLTAVVHASSYFVEVAGERTTLFLTEGEAWVGEVVRVHLLSGQSIRSDDPRFQPPPLPIPTSHPGAPVVRTEAPDTCATQSAPGARFDCYLQLSMGADEIAQNALFELGVIESEDRGDGPAAIFTWGAYLGRFPQGSLAPEARFSILSEYLAEHRAPESLREASAFLGKYPADPRDDEVRIAAASLGCTVGGQAEQGLALVEPLAAEATGATHGEALFVAATCYDRLGRAGDARGADQAYLNEFPTGPHAAEAQARLSSK